MPRPAAFLDRDGTIIDDVEYIARPELVRLRQGSARAIARLNAARVPVIVVTNQSGIARGKFTERDFENVQARVASLLGDEGARLDATYVCPHHPDFGDACECRKPGTLLFRRAAADHDLDVTRSFFIGDRWRDVAPALALGGHPILVLAESTPPDERERAEEHGIEVVPSLTDAVTRVLDAVDKSRSAARA